MGDWLKKMLIKLGFFAVAAIVVLAIDFLKNL